MRSHHLAIAIAAFEQCEAKGDGLSIGVVDRAGRSRVLLREAISNWCAMRRSACRREWIEKATRNAHGRHRVGGGRAAMRAVAANAHVLEWPAGVALCRVSRIAAWTTADWSNT
jgi:hypothetical protein